MNRTYVHPDIASIINTKLKFYQDEFGVSETEANRLFYCALLSDRVRYAMFDFVENNAHKTEKEVVKATYGKYK